ncbi:MAG TPA: UDP-N-acetylmuramoyl-tripeptide--D-alanyl-D-alanine ligase [Candidatus Tumulicola sp.]|jgi:UDP-N-acetylmuramoyl-tripeptide--D-alanyl-D-alanine ligase
MRLPVSEAVAATNATLLDAENAPAEISTSTDTRTLHPGDAFLALRGERFDGHDYVAEAVGRGAALLIVDRPERRVPGVATMVVAETKAAYMALAALARRRFAGYVLGITGSAGKTTTKAFAATLLAGRFGARVLAAPGNENNEIGVSRLLLDASNDEHDAIVVEMGARNFGDIATLVDIARPDVGILTNVGDAHLEIVGSRERLAETKWALFSRGARAVLGVDDAVSAARAPSLDKPPHWFAERDTWANLPKAAGRFVVVLGRERLVGFNDGARVFERPIEVTFPGAYNRANLAAAVAGALELDVTLEAIVSLVSQLRLPPGRFESFEMAGGWRIVYDAYNANAGGSIAALDALASQGAKRAIAVLGSMAELGAEAVELHERVGAHAARRAGIVLVGGDYADALARGAEQAGIAPESLVRIGSNAEGADWLREHARAGDVVLLKGSRKYRLEEILEELHG